MANRSAYLYSPIPAYVASSELLCAAYRRLYRLIKLSGQALRPVSEISVALVELNTSVNGAKLDVRPLTPKRWLN